LDKSSDYRNAVLGLLLKGDASFAEMTIFQENRLCYFV